MGSWQVRYGRKCLLLLLPDFCLDDYIPKAHLWICKERPIWTGHTSFWVCSPPLLLWIKIEEFIVDYCSSSFSVQNHNYPKGVSLHFFIFGLFIFFSVLKKPAPRLLYPFICCWTFGLFPCPGYCKQRCGDNCGQIATGNLLCRTGNSIQCSVMT